MGKYTDRRKEVHVEKDHTKSFAWRGIGCVMMIIIPLLSFAAASLTVNNPTARSVLPEGLLGTPVLPEAIFRATAEIQSLFLWITGIPDFYAILMVTAVYTVLFGSVTSFAYALVFRAVGPKTTNPFDVERPNVRTKRYKR